jgi:hypothetical protein
MGMPAAVPDLYAEGTISPTDPKNPSANFVTKSKGANRVRNEINSGNGEQVYVVNDHRGFSLISGQRNIIPSHTTANFRPEHLPAFACSIDPRTLDLSVTYVGLENLGTASVHHVVFRSTSLDPLDQLISEFHVYLDAKTLRVSKTANWAFAPDTVDNRSRWETYYDDYQTVGAMMFPMHLVHFLAGNRFDEWTFTKIRTDLAIADSDFD